MGWRWPTIIYELIIKAGLWKALALSGTYMLWLREAYFFVQCRLWFYKAFRFLFVLYLHFMCFFSSWLENDFFIHGIITRCKKNYLVNVTIKMDWFIFYPETVCTVHMKFILIIWSELVYFNYILISWIVDFCLLS